MLAALRGLGVNPEPSDVTRMFLRADRNRDGVIDFAEFERLYTEIYAEKQQPGKPKRKLEPSSDMRQTSWKDKKADDDDSFMGNFRKFFKKGD